MQCRNVCVCAFIYIYRSGFLYVCLCMCEGVVQHSVLSDPLKTENRTSDSYSKATMFDITSIRVQSSWPRASSYTIRKSTILLTRSRLDGVLGNPTKQFMHTSPYGQTGSHISIMSIFVLLGNSVKPGMAWIYRLATYLALFFGRDRRSAT